MGLMETFSRKACATCCVTRVCCSQSPHPRSRPLLTRASTGDTQTPKGRSGFTSVGSPGAGEHEVPSEPFRASLAGMVLVHTRFHLSPSEHLWRVWGEILSEILNESLRLCCLAGASPLHFHVASSFGGIQHSPVNGCSAASCSFGVLAGDECTSIYSAVLLNLF